MYRIILILAVAATMLTTAAFAHASVSNGIQPGAVYFGAVKAGQHPKRVVTLTNRTGRTRVLARYLIAGAGGSKFTLVGKDSTGKRATCHIGLRLANGASCTLVLRVKVKAAEWWQAVLSVYYRNVGAVRMAGQWNGSVYVHVVPA